MSKKEQIDGLIANEATQFAEGDRKWLEALHEDQLTAMVPVVNDEGEEFEPCCPDVVAKLIANKDSKWGADDADFLNLLTAGQLENMEPVIVEKIKEVKVNEKATYKTLEEFMDAVPDGELKDSLNSGMDMHRAKKDTIITKLLANDNNTFTKEQLTAKDVGELESLASLAKIVDYSGQSHEGGQHHNEGDEEEALEAPVINWDEK